MKISVLLPTRNRPELAERSIRSLLDNISVSDNLEVLVAIDEDDKETQDALVNKFPLVVKTFTVPRWGYEGLHKYINFLCDKSTGDWLMLWNDDAVMQTPNWDKYFEPYTGQMLALDIKTNHQSNRLVFAVVPRKYYELVGHFSLSPNNDTWILDVFEPLGLRKKINEVHALHDRFDMTGNNNDEMFNQQRKYMNHFKSREMVEVRKRDRDLVAKYVGYDFELQKKEWSKVPNDRSVYLNTQEVLEWKDGALHNEIRAMARKRYSVRDWRNYKNKWRAYLGLDSTKGKKILDFGCGVGIEALQFAPDNQVYLADINQANIDLAEKVLNVHGYTPAGKYLVVDKYPFVKGMEKIDVFYCNGVLHHIPYAQEVLDWVAEILNEDGEVRLMLYSDKMWEKAGKNQEKFIRLGDPVGHYADWYDAEKIIRMFGKKYKLVFYSYITPKDYYLVAILKLKGGESI